HPQMNSENHVMMLGDLLVWSYENLAGIKSKENGFQTIRMEPEMIDGLHSVNASYRSLYGEITSSWSKSKSAFEWTVSIPANAKAEIYLPTKNLSAVTEKNKKLQDHKDIEVLSEEAGKVKILAGSGVYHFKIKLLKKNKE